MDRRSFLRTNVGGSFLLGVAGGAAAGAAAMGAFQGPKARPGNTSHAQQGEDLVLWQIAYHALGIKNPTYLDIGANDPILTNNTYVFYQQGCRGVLVEPNPALWDSLATVRPGDVLLRAGIGPGVQREADFYVIGGTSHSLLNTFSKEDADNVVARSGGRFSIEKVVKLPLLDVNQVMQTHWSGPPTVLSLDTEGFELPILQSLDFKRYRPDVLCVDTLVFGTRRIKPEILKFMASKNYEVRGGSFVNTVFVDKRHTA